MTKQELVKLIKEYFANENGNVDTSEMDFGDTSVDISKLKIKADPFHNLQDVKEGSLFHNFKKVKERDLFHDFQKDS